MLIAPRYPFLEAAVTIGMWSLVEDFYLDTGFEGGLLIPGDLRDEILASPSWVRWRVAHDRIVRAPLWTGDAEVAGHSFEVEVAAMGSRFLMGRDVIDRFRVCFDHGRQLQVER